ncbi:MAG: tRNA (adenosine(37)-N6)-dimethylallyltransferase MiaA [Candidatus Kerfeldbacteria bacterium]
MQRRLIVILGPTASGKSRLGVLLAKKFRGVILSADSRQVYCGMDIGTAKITRREMHKIPHFLLDIASPRRTFTVAQYQRAAINLLKRIPESAPVFIVGGSPFYIDVILNPLPFPDVKPNPTLRKRLAKKPVSQLFRMLQQKDPRRARTIDRKNPRRLIRALEIVHALGRVPLRSHHTPYHVLKIGINMPRKTLYKRIDERVDERVPGILKETAELHRRGISWKRLDQFGLEYRWASRILNRKIPKREGIERLKGDIHAFSRRQMTWWRNDNNIHWIQNKRAAERLVSRFLK